VPAPPLTRRAGSDPWLVVTLRRGARNALSGPGEFSTWLVENLWRAIGVRQVRKRGPTLRGIPLGCPRPRFDFFGSGAAASHRSRGSTSSLWARRTSVCIVKFWRPFSTRLTHCTVELRTAANSFCDHPAFLRSRATRRPIFFVISTAFRSTSLGTHRMVSRDASGRIKPSLENNRLVPDPGPRGTDGPRAPLRQARMYQTR
jgi:hypothetical protein